MDSYGLRPIEDLPDLGKMMLIYGETGVGKTTSIFETAQLPLLYIPTEPRNAKISLKASKRVFNPGDIMVYEYTTWQGLMEFLLLNRNQILKFRTVALDSLSYLMNVRLSNAIEDEIYAAMDEDKKKKEIISSTKLTQEGFGGLSSQMSRLIKVLGDLTKEGIDVIMTALVQEYPKWDRDLSAGPALKGREFPNNLPGSCDLIGYIKPRIDNDGNKIFPPFVYFEAEDNEYLCKFTGIRPKMPLVFRPLEFDKILGANKKGEKKDAD